MIMEKNRSRARKAFVFAKNKEVWTWARLTSEVDRLASGLIGLGIQQGDRVALHMANLPEFVAAYLACFQVGAIAAQPSSAQIEPSAGNWKTWVLTSSDQLRFPPPPDEAATRAEIAQLKDIAKQRNASHATQAVTCANRTPDVARQSKDQRSGEELTRKMAGKDILFPFTVAANLNSPGLPVIARTHLNRRTQRIPLRHRQMLFAKDELGYLS
jgi:acyl-CoA synthetase (AMP-forming)/AMP-acid ligase II